MDRKNGRGIKNFPKSTKNYAKDHKSAKTILKGLQTKHPNMRYTSGNGAKMSIFCGNTSAIGFGKMG